MSLIKDGDQCGFLKGVFFSLRDAWRFRSLYERSIDDAHRHQAVENLHKKILDLENGLARVTARVQTLETAAKIAPKSQT